MKTKFKIFALTGLMAFAVTSCDDGDKIIDEITSTVTRGAILRTIETNGVFDRFNTSSTFDFTFEEQDTEGGDLLEKVDLYIGFEDNTEDNGTIERDELLIRTYLPADFTDGEFGLPRASYATTLAEALGLLNIVEGDFDGGDVIQYRLELTLTDGRTFSNDDNTGTITGSFFSSPFFYGPVIKCIPPAPVPGEYEIEIKDSFGDGWDGAKLVVTIDGDVTEYTLDDGSSIKYTFTVPDGTTEFIIEYVSGSFEDEHTYEIIAPTDEVAIADGPSPATGVVTLNICKSVS